MGEKTIIETDRLIIRPFRITDYPDCYQNYCSDPLTVRYLTWDVHPNPEFTKCFIQGKIEGYQKGLCLDWVVQLKADKTIIGSIGAVSFLPKLHTCEIGYAYGSRFWHQGYGTEALKALIRFLFTEYKIDFITAKYIKSNVFSGKVMKKAHMLVIGHEKNALYNPNLNKREDCIIRAIDLKSLKKYYL
ncbi:MAG: GNAT family N-acetyltransferase [Bacilli bacterium]